MHLGARARQGGDGRQPGHCLAAARLRRLDGCVCLPPAEARAQGRLRMNSGIATHLRRNRSCLSLLVALAACVIGALASAPARAQSVSFAGKTITLMCHTAPGGGYDAY